MWRECTTLPGSTPSLHLHITVLEIRDKTTSADMDDNAIYNVKVI
jgi:hypothetical protein